MSTSSIATTRGAPPAAPRSSGRDRAVALALVLGAQLMIILDMTVVNVALPSIARDLHFSPTGLSWVLNAYTLPFGGLLLLGGRAGDILGRRRVFMAGLALFTVASLAGGLATSAGQLLAARVAQGAGGAVAIPAVLALITASFPEGRERTRALGLFTAVAMGGASLGLVLGGVIVQWASWRWVLFVNVPIGALVLALAPRFLPETPRQPGHFDLAGALSSTAGMSALVYAFIRAAAAGWQDRLTLAALAAALVLLGLFLLNEARAAQPITPLRLFAAPGRAGSYLARLLLVAGMFGMFFLLTLFVQDELRFSPLQAGLAFVPMTAMLFAVSTSASRLLARFAPKVLMAAGLVPVISGMAWLSQITPGTHYVPGVLGPMLLLGAGMGVVFVPLTMASLAGVESRDAGAAASMVNVMQQVGGSLGLAILVNVFTSASHGAAGGGIGAASPATRDAIVHGMGAAFGTAAIFDTIAALIILAFVGTWRRLPAPATATRPGPAAAPARVSEPAG
jgi:EmrB/QacA subfamily drug resistance transporter